jgi:hypothetical protein
MQSDRVQNQDRQPSRAMPLLAPMKHKHRARRRRATTTTHMQQVDCYQDFAELPWPARMVRLPGVVGGAAREEELPPCKTTKTIAPQALAARRTARSAQKSVKPTAKYCLISGQLLSICCLLVLVPIIYGSQQNPQLQQQQIFATNKSYPPPGLGKKSPREIAPRV